MNPDTLDKMITSIKNKNLAIDSILIIRDGYLVLDYYGLSYGPEDRHIIHSCTKSIVSTLVGIALDQGLIESLDQPVSDFFPDLVIEIDYAHKELTLTLTHLLTMTSGLDSRDSYLYRWKGIREMMEEPDWVSYILSLPSAAEAGEHFDYSNMASYLLSAVITRVTGQSALVFARENLFTPLGIENVEWPSYQNNVSIGWGEMRISAPDLAKFGFLILHKGKWDGTQIVSEDYLAEATSVKIKAGTLQNYYGYQWWIQEEGLFMAQGYAGQFLIIYPAENLVVVFNSTLDERDSFAPRDYFNDYILKSIQ
ncbi:serine hydrolase [Oceanispirochaeta sp. M1]|uniref:serine hydrolase domain-containing protein n=2 Tax=Oceanispirochaeta TaxID=2035349 RepID=UPI0014951BBC|nr:serine hydrolase [Oceanispirochaeta sp. M1]